MSAVTKKRVITAIRIAVCALALWIVIRGVTLDDRLVLHDGRALSGTVHEEAECITLVAPDGSTRLLTRSDLAVDEGGGPKIAYGLRTSWHAGRKALLLVAVIVHMPVAFLLAWRLRVLLAVQDIGLSYWQCVKLSFAGNFLNFATPLGSNAGDVFKAYFVALHTPRKTEAVTTVALDRAVGLGALLLVVATITLLAEKSSPLAGFRVYLLSVVVLGVLTVLAYLAPPLRGLLVRGSQLLPHSVAAQLGRIDQATRGLMKRPLALLASLLITSALQGLAIGAYFVVAAAFGMNTALDKAPEYYAYFAVGAVVQSLPGPPQGLGTVELTYRYFFSALGSPSQILCVAFFVRIVVLACALPGAWVTLTGAYRPGGAQAVPFEKDKAPSPRPTKVDDALLTRP